MLWEQVKEKNGFKTVKVNDLEIGDVFLFEDQKEDEQANKVVDIFDNGSGDIFVEYVPEYTPVRNSSMFRYGTIKFIVRPKNEKK